MLRCDLPDSLHGRNANVCNITTAQMPENVLAVACIDTGVLVVFKDEAVWMASSSLQVQQHPARPFMMQPLNISSLLQVLQSLQREPSCPVVCRSLPWGEVLVGISSTCAVLFDAHGARACINDLPPSFGNLACCFPFMAAMHESGYASIVSVSDWNTLGRIVVPPRITHFADNGQRLYGTNAGCVYELQMLKDVAPSIAARDSRCIRTLPPDIAWSVASGVDMLMTSPLFTAVVYDDSQFVASLQEVQRCVERLQSLAGFVCSLQAAQGIACADRLAIDTEIERAVQTAAHDFLIQQLRIRHTRDDALIAEAASFFLSMDPEDMGVASGHAAAVREAVAFSMHRKHRSLNRRRSSIDALSMLSRGDNVSPAPADTDIDGRASVYNEQEGGIVSDNIDAVAVKQCLDVVLEEEEALLQEPDQQLAPRQLEEALLEQQQYDLQPRNMEQFTPQSQDLSSNFSSSLFLPIDVLSIDSSISGGVVSQRCSPQEEDIAAIDIISPEVASAAPAEHTLKNKRRGSTGTFAGVGDGRRGSVEFDSDSFYSLGGGGAVSFTDLSESAQVCAAACFVMRGAFIVAE